MTITNSLTAHTHLPSLLPNVELKPTGSPLSGADTSALPASPQFSHYWSLLGRAVRSAKFSQWMTRVGIHPDSMHLTPAKGRIAFTLKPELDPRQVVRRLGRNDPGFAAASSEVMAIARLITAGNPDASFKPPLSPRSPHVPLEVVRHFEQGHESRSETVLERHQAALADNESRYRVGDKLRELSRTLEANAASPIDMRAELTRLKVKTPLQSSYQPANADNAHRISLKQYLDDHQLSLPTQGAQLANLAAALMTPAPIAPVNGNCSGALGWPAPVDPSIVAELTTIITQGKVGKINVGDSKNVLEYLTDKRVASAAEVRDPRHLLDNLVRSSKGKALGAALQAHFQAKSIKGSANDWLLAAMGLSKGETAHAAGAHARAEIPEYPLMRAENAGKTAEAVVAELRVALQLQGKASNAQSAALHATLRLSSQAPEFLVKDIPASVVLGSHAWVSFVTAVARIEAKAPGATAAMSYAQVMLHASIAPVTAHEQHSEYLAQNQALKPWALANGLGAPTNEATMKAVRTAFDAQVQMLSHASSIALGATPSRKALALDALKIALPAIDPKLLESQCITLQPAYRTFAGPYSLLDLYLDGRPLTPGFPGPSHKVEQYGQAHLIAGLPSQAVYAHTQQVTVPESRWVSASNAINITEALNTLKTLPDISQTFDSAFSTFATQVQTLTKTQIKQLISTLPLQDRQNLEFGKVTVAREMDLASSHSQQPRRSRTTEGSVLVKTERDGQVHTYEINRLKGEIIKRRDLGDFPVGPRDLGGRHPYKAFEIIQPDGSYSPGVRDEQVGAVAIPQSFSSERTAFIADAIVKDLDVPALKKQARGATTFDTERPRYEAGVEFALNLIPLRSSIVKFQKGDLAEGLSDLGMDIFGFLIGVGTAAKAGKAAMAGASAWGKAAQVVKIIGRTAIGSLNPVSGLDDVARGIGAGLRKTFAAAHEGISHLRGAVHSADLIDVIKRHDVAQGTFKSAHGISEGKVTAQLDDLTQQWYAYDPRTKQAYGKPLEGFVAEQSTLAGNADSLLHAGLSHDNVVSMGGRMKNVKFIGPEIHTFEDTYKGTKRLNITVHGDAPRPGNLFLLRGTKAYVDDVPYDAKGLLALLKSQGVSPEHFDNVRLLVCYGANGVGTSLAKQFQSLVKRPVKAFEGPVMLNYGSTAITADRIDILQETASLFPNAMPQHVQRMADWRLRKELKAGAPHNVLKEHGKSIIVDTSPLNGPPSSMTMRINYQPRHFS